MTLFECFEQVVFALKEEILPYSKNIFDRCVKILANVLQGAKRDYESLPVMLDFFMRSMDLIDRILQALREKAEPIVVQSNFIEILLEFT